MKPNDKAIEAAATSLFGSHDVEKKWVEEALIAAYAAQFNSEEYAGLVKILRSMHKQITSAIKKDDPWAVIDETVPSKAADAIEAVLAERDALNFELAARKEWPQARAEMLEELAKVRAERDALAARLAPVDDEKLVEIVADAISDGSKNIARAAIAAIRPHIEAAEREKIAETAKNWGDEPHFQLLAAAIRRGE